MDEIEKKKYERPTVSRVKLKPEEAALTACKTGSTSGPAQQTCTGGGGGGACQQKPAS